MTEVINTEISDVDWHWRFWNTNFDVLQLGTTITS